MPPSNEEQISILEDARRDAMLTADVAALAEILHDDLVYVHSNGSVDTKRSYLEAIETGRLVYRSVSSPNRRLVDHGSTVVGTGDAEIEVVVDGAARLVTAVYTFTYVAEESRWMFTSWQSTSTIP